jgi:hypothetical protein
MEAEMRLGFLTLNKRGVQRIAEPPDVKTATNEPSWPGGNPS